MYIIHAVSYPSRRRGRVSLTSDELASWVGKVLRQAGTGAEAYVRIGTVHQAVEGG